jgi:hypothetical protein
MKEQGGMWSEIIHVHVTYDKGVGTGHSTRYLAQPHRPFFLRFGLFVHNNMSAFFVS